VEAEKLREEITAWVAPEELVPSNTEELAVAFLTDCIRVHDWRNYVPDLLRRLWGELSDEARLATWCVCEELADAEDWD
jgi:hypothetical protein